MAIDLAFYRLELPEGRTVAWGVGADGRYIGDAAVRAHIQAGRIVQSDIPGEGVADIWQKPDGWFVVRVHRRGDVVAAYASRDNAEDVISWFSWHHGNGRIAVRKV